ncbi:MAG: SpoIIE family protein phosphatase [Candidatus Riflebacteria bacterium]|nr:SpoIIE family protein phosphatase [Candidatus Riflebacteria bacterium]
MKIIFRWLVTCTIFFALPLILLCTGFGKRIGAREAALIEKKYQELESTAFLIRQKADTRAYFEEGLRRLSLRLKTSSDQKKFLSHSLYALKKRFPGVFQFTVLGDDGKFIPELSDNISVKPISQKIFKLAAETPEKSFQRESSFNGIIGFIRAAFGPYLNPEDFRKSSSKGLIRSSSSPERAFFGYFLIQSNYSLFVSLAKNTDWDILAARNLCHSYSSFTKRREISLGLYDFSHPNRNISSEIYDALSNYHRYSNQKIRIGNRLFFIVPITTNTCLWTSESIGKLHQLDQTQMGTWVVAIILFSILAYFSFKIMVIEEPFPIAIRQRLLLLFAFAGGLPLIVVAFSGIEYLAEKQKSMEEELAEQTEQYLIGFDSRFQQMVVQLEKYLNSVCNKISIGTEQERKDSIKILNSLVRQSLAEVMIIDKKGKIKEYRITGDLPEASGLRQILKKIAGSLLASVSGEEKKGSINALELIMDSFGHNSYDMMISTMGRLNFQFLGNDRGWEFASPIKSSNGKAEKMLVVTWGAGKIDNYYVEKKLLSAQRDIVNSQGGNSSAFLWAAFPIRDTAGYRVVPEKFIYKNQLEKYIKQSTVKQGSSSRKVLLNSQEWLITSIKTKELYNAYLFAVRPLKPIKDEINSLEKKLWLFVAICLIMSLFLGNTLSKHFLEPIRNLSDGALALQKQQFDIIIPVGAQDELGELAATFNKMIESLSEVAHGKLIQEGLLPPKTLEFEEYRFYGQIKYMSQMGGDYFDSLILPDGRMLVVIGDVSGHGVASAMVMGMAKALVVRETRTSNSPEKILSSIHEILLLILARSKSMTCFLGILDPKTHTFCYSNAGHVFPILYRMGEPPIELQAPSFPMGIVKKIKYQAFFLDFQPGDCIVFYSDGLIEAIKPNGEMVGYEFAKNGIKSIISEDPAEMSKRIFEWHNQIIGNTPQSDDITIAVLTRKGNAQPKKDMFSPQI